MRAPAIIVAVIAVAAVPIAGCGGSGTDRTTTVTVSTSNAGTTVPADSDGAAAVEDAFEHVISTVAPSVVLIQTNEALGSGVVYDDSGNIVTNAHVVGSAKTFSVTLSRGDRHPAKLVGTDPADDLAVVRLESGTAKPAVFGDSSKLAVGQLTLAVGNPLGLRSSVTNGIVSSLGRTVSEGNGVVISAAIQTSASINPGNSGGALVDLDAQVIGIPTLAATDPQLGGTAPGIGFAIPSSTVKRIVPQLIATGHVSSSGHAYLGVSVSTRMGEPGALVASVVQGGPADKAGVQEGDVITAVNGKPVASADDLSTVLAELKPGQHATLTVTRPDGSKATLDVTLGENPE
jgi:S1-C subfamily serine protease